MLRRRGAARAVAPFALALTLGCGPRSTTHPPAAAGPPPDDVVGTTEPAPAAPPNRPRPPTCGTAGLSLETYDWIPADARLAVTIALAEPEATAALEALAAHGRTEAHGLPIAFAFGVTQWPILVPVLGTLLDSVGLQPNEVVYVGPSTGPAFAWVVRSDCDLDEAVARVQEAWGLVPHRRVEGVVCTAPPDPNAGDGTLRDPADAGADTRADADPNAFPYDVVFARGGRLALVPRGYGDAFLTMLDAPMGTPSAAEWTQRIEAIAPAPVRGVLSGRALVDSKTKRVPATMTLSAHRDGVVLDTLTDPDAPAEKKKKR